MSNYRLVFDTQFDDGYSAGTAGAYARIVAAPSETLAKAIATAMLGENISQDIWLNQVTSVDPTEAAPYFPQSLLTTGQIWKRVMDKLQLTVPVCFWYDDTLKKIIGFRFFPLF